MPVPPTTIFWPPATARPILIRSISARSGWNLYKTPWIRLPLPPLPGKPKPYSALPWFWSDQFDLKLQIAGLNQGYTDVVIRGDMEGGRSFAAFYLKDNKILAVDAINRGQEFMLGKRLITEKIEVDADKLRDENFALKGLLA